MSGRYSKSYDLNTAGAFGQKEGPPPARKTDPWAKMLELAGMAAPAVGTGIGMLAGGPVGAAVGGAIGSGVGGLAGMGAQEMQKDEDEEYEAGLRNREERGARQQAALQLLGGF
jgi:hypothetical protein